MKLFVVQTSSIDNNILEATLPALDSSVFPYTLSIRKQLTDLNLVPQIISKVAIKGLDCLVAFTDRDTSTLKGFSGVAQESLPKEIDEEINQYKNYILAKELSKKWHGEQKYSFLKLPYYYHLKQTEKVIDHFFWELPAGKTLILKTAALLHDVLEDTSASAKDIENIFGEEVLDIVNRVTKINEEDTEEYETNYYKNIAVNPLAVYIKIADKCANTRQTVKHYSEWHAKRIVDGHDIFKQQTYGGVDSQLLKNYLDNLVNKLRFYNEKGIL